MKSRLTVLVTALFTMVIGCVPTVTQQEAARAVEGYIEDVNKLAVVDCLLPGQMRKLGTSLTYLSARRPIRTTEADCEVRGGEYVAYDRANYASALNVWQEKANEGDATAQLYVGQIYEKGLGRPADYRAAATWYRKAAEQGNAQAQINLGHLYEKGLGVPKEPKAAIDWYGKAAGLENAGLFYAAATSAAPGRNRPTSYAAPAPIATALGDAKAQSVQSMELANQVAESKRLRDQLQMAQRQMVEQQALLRKSQEELASVKRASTPLPASRVRGDDTELREREAELERKEAQLKSRQAELSRMNESIREERDQAGRATSVSPPAVDPRVRQLEGELKAKQAEISRMNEAIDAERARMQQDMASALRQAKTAGAVSPVADESRIRALETDLQQKETQLKAQQAKVSSMSKTLRSERAKMQKELNAAIKQANAQKSSGAAVSAVSTPPQLEEARKTVTRIEGEVESKTAQYNRNSAELTTWLTTPSKTSDDGAMRARIDQRKAELQTQAQEINALREQLGQATRRLEDIEQAPSQLAQAGPRIEIIRPQILTTRGIPSLQVSPDLRELLGRVESTKGLKSLSVNNTNLNIDATGIFRIPIDQTPPNTLLITAVDKNNQQTDFSLNLIMEGGASQAEFPTATSRSNQNVSYKTVDMGKFYALIIGNSDYSAYPDLKTPLNDARSVDVLLRERFGFSTKVVLNGNRYAIMTALNEIQRHLTEKDNLLIYYAGHGEIDTKTQEAYWLPVDAEVGNTANWIPSKAITDLLSIMPAKHILVVSDSCYSGAMSGSAVAKLPDEMDPDKKEKWLKVMATKKARTVLTSGDVKPVLDEGGEGHSIFAEAFLQALRGTRGLIEDYELYRMVMAKVTSASAKIGFNQTPTYAPLQYAGHEGSPFFFIPGG